RRPLASVNFVTCHDGFTLHDLVSYEHKRNEANGEGNRDGESRNRSWNCGSEGVTGDPEVLALRRRQMRNLTATLMLSQGVPMLSHGDEFARTQHGNNNAYCQDSELSWVHWPDGGTGAGSAGEADPAHAMCAFVSEMARLRRAHPVFRRRRFFNGRRRCADAQDELPDIAWCTPEGDDMAQRDWQAGQPNSLTVFLNGSAISEPGPRGEPVGDDSFLLLFNAHHQALDFVIPAGLGRQWHLVVDTALEQPPSALEGRKVQAGDRITLTDHSLVVLRRPA
ncbi:MAG: glycogen debranching enzyme, partial [Streptomyces sp.]